MELTAWLLLLYGLTAVSTGFNAQYFWGYQPPTGLRTSTKRARRLAALALLHGALFLENAFFAVAFLFGDVLSVSKDGSLLVALPPALWLPLRAFLVAVS